MNNGVSVIIPLFNRESYIAECLESVLSQERDFPIEVIVVDDGSTDKGPERVADYPSPVRLIDKPIDCKEQGPGPARNRGIVLAQYPYLAFLDSDDLFLPGHLKRLHEVLEQQPNIAVVLDELYGFETDPGKRWIMPYPEHDIARLETVFLNPYLSLCVSMIRKSALDDLGEAFDTSLRMAEDIDLFLRILEKPAMRDSIRLLAEPGTVVREHSARSVNNVRECYRYAESAMQKALARHPYPKRLVQKRRAVLHFRFAQADLTDRKYGSALFHLLRAFFLDPIRAMKILAGKK